MQKISTNSNYGTIHINFIRNEKNMKLVEERFFESCPKIGRTLFNDFLKVIKNKDDINIGKNMFDIIISLNKPIIDKDYICGLYHD